MQEENQSKSFEEKLEGINKSVLAWVEKTNQELLRLNKQALPEWDKWFSSGKNFVCGIQFFYYLSLYPQERTNCVRYCVTVLRDLWEHKSVKEVKDAVSSVFEEMIREKKAIGGPIGPGSVYFWERLEALTREVLVGMISRIPRDKRSDELDEETGNLISEKIINLDFASQEKEENDRIEAIAEREFLESLDDAERTVWKMHIWRNTEQEIEEDTGINKSKVHRMIKNLREKYKAWSES